MTRLIAIGASAGGLAVLRQVIAAMPGGLDAALLVVLHIGRYPSLLPELLSACGPLPATHARDGEPIRAGHVFIAPPDQHMLVEGGRIRLLRGPKEHHTRPAIDPLFRTAALAYGQRVIGVVLSGMFDDGTAGLQSIKACGGIAVVQDPAEAREPGMPQSAIQHVSVDHIARSDELGSLLVHLATVEEVPPMPQQHPTSIEHEVALMTGQGDALDHLRHIGVPSTYACPDCHGTLWQVAHSEPKRFRCHTGHGFTARTLDHAMAAAADQAIWSALRAVQERRLLLLDRSDGQAEGAAATLADRLAQDIATLRQMLSRVDPEPQEPDRPSSVLEHDTP